MRQWKPIPPFKPVRFLKMINKGRHCWFWNGYRENSGYGVFTINGGKFKAHRVSYYLHHGNISETLLIDHKCRNRHCVNPDHLRQVTYKVNALENSIGKAPKNKAKTHCLNGHDLSKTAKIIGRRRSCNVCQKDRLHKWYLKQKQLGRR